MRFSAQEFRKRHFGPGSSHPGSVAQTVKIFTRIAFVPLLVLAGLAAIAVIEFPELLIQAGFYSSGVRALVLAFFLAVSASATVALSASVSRRLAQVEDRAPAPDGVSLRWCVIGVALGIVVPIVGPGLAVLPDTIRFICRLSAVLPVFMLLLFIAGGRKVQPGEEEAGTEGDEYNRLFPGVLVLVVGLLALQSVLAGLFTRIGASEFWVTLGNLLPFLEDIPGRVGALVIVLPLFVIFQLVRRVWPVRRDKEVSERREERVIGSGLVRRLLRWWMRFFGWLPRAGPDPDGQDSEEDLETPPEWLELLLEEVGIQATAVRVDLEHSSSPIEPGGSELASFFAGFVPTKDQVRALDRFLKLHEQSRTAKTDWKRVVPASDLLILGEHGSGRSKTLHACLLAAVFVRGQGALVIVPDDARRKNTVERIRQDVESIGMSDFAVVEEGGGQILGGWIVQRAAALRRIDEGSDEVQDLIPLPEVLVTVPADLERHVFGRQCDEYEGRALRELLAHFDCVFVEDLDQFRGGERAHLPFLLDKLRLLCAASFRQPQVVIVAPPLESAAISVAGERLFGVRSFDVFQNSVSLRPRPLEPCWLVISEYPSVDAMDEVREKISRAAVDLGLCTLVYLRSIDHEDAESGQRLADQRPDLVRVIGDLDSADLLGMEFKPSLGVYCASLRSDDLFQFRSGLDSISVLLSLGVSGMPAVEKEMVEKVPVFPPRDAEGLSSLHLATALPFLPIGLPTSSAFWSDVGFNRFLAEQVHMDESLPGSWIVDEIPGRPEVEAFHILLSSPDVNPVIDPTVVLPVTRRGYGCHVKDGTFHVRVEPVEEGAALAVATWQERDESGAILAQCELAHIREMQLSRNGRQLVPRSLASRADGRLAIIAMPGQGAGRDATHPVIDLEFEFEGRSPVQIGFLSSDRGIAVCRAKRLAHRVRSTLSGLASEYGELNQTGLFRFEQACWVGAMLLAPRKMHDTDVEPVLSRLFEGRWSTLPGEDPSFLPGLTAAINLALEVHFDGAPWFGRVAVFSLDRFGKSRPAEAVCFILQPEAVHHAVENALDIGLRSDSLRIAFLDTAHAFLDACQSLEGSPEDIRRRLRGRVSPCVGVAGELRLEDSLTILQASIRGDLGSLSIDVDWKNHREWGPPIPGGVDSAGRAWSREYLTDWPGLASMLEGPLSRALGMTPGLSWSLSLLRAAIQLPRESFESKLQPVGSVNYHHDRIELRPAAGVSPGDFLQGAIEALESGFQGFGFRDQGAVTLELRLRGGLQATTSSDLESIPFDLRVELGVFPDLSLSLARQSVSTRPWPDQDEPSTDIQLPPSPAAEELEAAWTVVQDLQEPSFDRKDQRIMFSWRGRECCMEFGLPEGGRASFEGLFECLDARPGGPYWDNYLSNDPFPTFVRGVSERLKNLYGKPVDADYADFALAFIQAIPYVPDPEDKGDWARFPSEYFSFGGGDCEDSSLAYVALLLDAGLETAFLEFPGHVAVGVRGPYNGAFFKKDGSAWYLAETALISGSLPIGAPPENGRALEDLVPCRLRGLPPSPNMTLIHASIDVTEEGGVLATFSVLTRRRAQTMQLVIQRRLLSDGSVTRVAEVKLPNAASGPAVLRGRLDLTLESDRGLGEMAFDMHLWSEGRLLSSWKQAGTVISTLLGGT